MLISISITDVLVAFGSMKLKLDMARRGVANDLHAGTDMAVQCMPRVPEDHLQNI